MEKPPQLSSHSFKPTHDLIRIGGRPGIHARRAGTYPARVATAARANAKPRVRWVLQPPGPSMSGPAFRARPPTESRRLKRKGHALPQLRLSLGRSAGVEILLMILSRK